MMNIAIKIGNYANCVSILDTDKYEFSCIFNVLLKAFGKSKGDQI